MAQRSRIPIVVGIVGPGLIGGTLIKQVAAQVRCSNHAAYLLIQTPKVLSQPSQEHCVLSQRRTLQNDLFLDMHVVAIISTRAMFLYNQKGCDLDTWQTDMAMGVSQPYISQYTHLSLVAYILSELSCHVSIISCWLSFLVKQEKVTT